MLRLQSTLQCKVLCCSNGTRRNMEHCQAKPQQLLLIHIHTNPRLSHAVLRNTPVLPAQPSRALPSRCSAVLCRPKQFVSIAKYYFAGLSRCSAVLCRPRQTLAPLGKALCNAKYSSAHPRRSPTLLSPASISSLLVRSEGSGFPSAHCTHWSMAQPCRGSEGEGWSAAFTRHSWHRRALSDGTTKGRRRCGGLSFARRSPCHILSQRSLR